LDAVENDQFKRRQVDAINSVAVDNAKDMLAKEHVADFSNPPALLQDRPDVSCVSETNQH
jgi:hypothetical protein